MNSNRIFENGTVLPMRYLIRGSDSVGGASKTDSDGIVSWTCVAYSKNMDYTISVIV